MLLSDWPRLLIFLDAGSNILDDFTIELFYLSIVSMIMMIKKTFLVNIARNSWLSNSVSLRLLLLDVIFNVGQKCSLYIASTAGERTGTFI